MAGVPSDRLIGSMPLFLNPSVQAMPSDAKLSSTITHAPMPMQTAKTSSPMTIAPAPQVVVKQPTPLAQPKGSSNVLVRQALEPTGKPRMLPPPVSAASAPTQPEPKLLPQAQIPGATTTIGLSGAPPQSTFCAEVQSKALAKQAPPAKPSPPSCAPRSQLDLVETITSFQAGRNISIPKAADRQPWPASQTDGLGVTHDVAQPPRTDSRASVGLMPSGAEIVRREPCNVIHREGAGVHDPEPSAVPLHHSPQAVPVVMSSLQRSSQSCKRSVSHFSPRNSSVSGRTGSMPPHSVVPGKLAKAATFAHPSSTNSADTTFQNSSLSLPARHLPASQSFAATTDLQSKLYACPRRGRRSDAARSRPPTVAEAEVALHDLPPPPRIAPSATRYTSGSRSPPSRSELDLLSRHMSFDNALSRSTSFSCDVWRCELEVKIGNRDSDFKTISFSIRDDLGKTAAAFLARFKLNPAFQTGLMLEMQRMLASNEGVSSVDIVDLI